MQELLLFIAVIFLGLTPLVWPKFLDTLERVGWVSGTIVAIIAMVTWMVGDVPFLYRAISGMVAIAILGVTTGWSRVRNIGKRELDVKLSAFFDLKDEVISRIDFRVEVGHQDVAFEVQVGCGYGVPVQWATLDLRQYAIPEVQQGKVGSPIRRLTLVRHKITKFTFVTVWNKGRRAVIKTVEPDIQPIFKDIRLGSIYPEIYARFVGLSKVIEKKYVVVFNEPPFLVAKRQPDGTIQQIRPKDPVLFVPTDSRKGKELIRKREASLGRKKKDVKITMFKRDDSTTQVSMTKGDS